MGNRFASSKQAISICDRCGFRFRLKELRELIVKTKKTNILACKSCWEPDHPQLQLGMYPVDDPQALRNPRPDSTYIQSGSNALGSRVTPFGLPVNTNTNDIINPNDFKTGWVLTNATAYAYGDPPTPSPNQIIPNNVGSTWSLDQNISRVGLITDPTGGNTAYRLSKSTGTYNGAYRNITPISKGNQITIRLSATVKTNFGSQYAGLWLETTNGSPTQQCIATFDLLNNTVYSYASVNVTGVSMNIVNNAVNASWKDISITFTSPILGTVLVRVMPVIPDLVAFGATDVYNPQLVSLVYNLNLTISQLTSPAGTLSQVIVPTNTNGLHYISQTFTQKTRYVMGVCAKPVGYSTIRIQNADNTVGATFDISVGKISAVVGGANVIPKAVYVGNGFWQCTILCTTIPSSELRIYIGDGVTAYTGNGLSGVVLWGAWVSDGEEPYYGAGSDTWWINNTVQGA